MMKKFLERWFRIRTKQDALYFRQRLAIIYAIVGWNCFGVMFYMLVKDEIPKDPKERRAAYGLLTGTPNHVHVYQVTGLTITNEFDVASKAKVAQIERETEENEKATVKTDEP